MGFLGGRIRFFFFFIFGFALLYSFPAFSLCGNDLAGFGGLDLPTREDYVKWIEESLGQRASGFPPIDRYMRLFTTLRAFDSQVELNYPSQKRNADMRVIVTLPSKGEATVWDEVPIGKREIFLRAIEDIFHRGKYDRSLKGVRSLDNPIYDDLHQLQERTLLDNYDPFEPELHRVGFSPVKALQAANRGETVGVCRHYNAAMMGIFLEMGIPKNQLRFVRGMRFEPGKKGNHIWMEVRLEKNGEWLEFDATPKLERPTKSNREIYIYDQEVITDFISAVENPAS